jgi:hypothetical protein
MSIPKTLVLACLSGITMFSFINALAQGPGGRKIVNPYQSIENKYSLANPEDQNSIRALADEIFNFPRSFPRMPSQMEGMVKDRLVRAEILYREGKRTGIQDNDFVRTLNDLADVLEVPPHTRTTLSQVRVLRMWLALSEPRFMGTGIARQDIAPGESINSVMGPLQAAHLMATLIDQKFMNPDFQVSPEEWEATSHQEFMKKLQTEQARGAEVRANPGHPIAALRSRGSYSSEKRRALEESLFRSISSLTVKDGLDLVNHTLSTLGID